MDEWMSLRLLAHIQISIVSMIILFSSYQYLKWPIWYESPMSSPLPDAELQQDFNVSLLRIWEKRNIFICTCLLRLSHHDVIKVLYIARLARDWLRYTKWEECDPWKHGWKCRDMTSLNLKLATFAFDLWRQLAVRFELHVRFCYNTSTCIWAGSGNKRDESSKDGIVSAYGIIV